MARLKLCRAGLIIRHHLPIARYYRDTTVKEKRNLYLRYNQKRIYGGTVRELPVLKELIHIKIGIITLLLFGMVIALTGTVCADQGVPAVPGNVGITTQTARVVDGIVMEQYSLAWQISNQSLAGRTDDPMFGTDQVQYTTCLLYTSPSPRD